MEVKYKLTETLINFCQCTCAGLAPFKADTLLLFLANYFHYGFAFGADSLRRAGQFNGNEIGFS